MSALRIANLSKRFGTVDVLKSINLDIQSGELIVLVGPSGCGKSTMLSIIAGLEKASDGEIEIAGRVVNDIPAKDRDIAMVFQSYALYPTMTVRQNITFGMRCRGVAATDQQKALNETAKLLQIDHLLDRKPSQLSGGQRQRVAMGRALVRKPLLFLFDEPLSNLDAKLRLDMRMEIKRLHNRLGTTIVYVTHDQIEAMTLATKIAVLKEGVLQQVGTPYDIYNHPANLFVADFMGSPSMNLMTGKIARADGSASVMLERDEGAPIALPTPRGVDLTHLIDGQAVIMGIRPEAITDRDGADRNSTGVSMVEARVDVVQPAGSDTFVFTRIAGKEVTARMRAEIDVQPGQMVPFAFNLDKALLFDPASGARL
jgi:multiple sugar transport system ATP-binding protein